MPISSEPPHGTVYLLRQSWDIFLDRFGPLFIAHLVFNVIVSGVASFTCGLGGVVLSGPLWFGLSRIALCAVRSEPTPYEDMFTGFKLFLPTFIVGAWMTFVGLLGASAMFFPTLALSYRAWLIHSEWLFIFSTSIGCTLSLVPFCAVIVLYGPAFFFIHDGELNARAALRSSRRLVLRNLRRWLQLWAALSVLHLIGLLVCCLGTFIVTPWMVVALSMVYNQERNIMLSSPLDARS